MATPLLGDPHFARTVVYLLEHDGGGTVGVILNRPSHTPVGQVLPEWHEAVSGPAVVFGGGPVQPDGALCLGQLDGDGPGVRRVVDGVGTVDLDGDLTVIVGLTRRLRVF
ncbi:MAG: putative transcriptional regulator, partial [Pseudonocardiales bacterium]|nr:putative transcriptional regulator [Pseudonocardiales bacterium]